MIGLLKKFRRKFLQSRTSTNFYIFSKKLVPLKEGLAIGVAKNSSDFQETLKRHNLQLHSTFDVRFNKRRDWFVYLTDSKEILCHGWVLNSDRFYHFEIDKTSCHKDNRLIYDFVTPEKHRKKGYYSMLISNLPEFLEEERLCVAAVTSNVASNKGIEKAGYVPFEIEYCED